MDTLSLLRRRAGARRFSHDSNKSRRVQARAADQRAVDLGLGHELVDVLGLDAAAVEDPDALGDLLRPELRERSEERRVGKSVDLGGRRIIKKKKRKRIAEGQSVDRERHWLRDIKMSTSRN